MSAPSIHVNTARLSPLSIGTVSRIQNGTDELRQIELIQLQQNAMSFATLSTPFPPAAATVEHLQEGVVDSRPDVQRITLSPVPTGGTFNLTIDGENLWRIPFDVGTAEFQEILGEDFTVRKVGTASWEITTVENGAIDSVTVDVANLIVPTGVSGVLPLNTLPVWSAFIDTTKKVLTLTLEVQIVADGQDPETILQMPVEISRNVINLATLEATTLVAAQAAYAALLADGVNAIWTTAITALTGGGTALDAESTETKGLGFRIDFPLNGFIRKFILKAGPADPDNPTGEVAPLDYDAGTNDKHWEEAT